MQPCRARSNAGRWHRQRSSRLLLLLSLAATSAVLLAPCVFAQVQFAALLPRCAITCEPPKRCVLVSGAIVCRDGCWPNRCHDGQLCMQRKSCSAVDPDPSCMSAVACIDIVALSLPLTSSDDDTDGAQLTAVADPIDPAAIPTPSLSFSDSKTRQCVQGDPNTCERFQQCVATDLGFRCADTCDPARCPLGLSCQLEPTQCTYPPCLRVAVCVRSGSASN